MFSLTFVMQKVFALSKISCFWWVFLLLYLIIQIIKKIFISCNEGIQTAIFKDELGIEVFKKKSIHNILVGFSSGLWLGHSKEIYHLSVDLLVCFESLHNLNVFKGTTFFFRIRQHKVANFQAEIKSHICFNIFIIKNLNSVACTE